MRTFLNGLSLALLAALTGCSHPPQPPALVFPNGFVGTFEIQSANRTGLGPRPDRGQLVVTLPADGIRQIDPEVYQTYFTQEHGCLGWLPRFADGQTLPLFAPGLPFGAKQMQSPMLLGLLQTNGTLYGIVDTHDNLTLFYQRFHDDLRQQKHDGLKRVLDDFDAAYAQALADLPGVP